jgi:hypothetical protein
MNILHFVGNVRWHACRSSFKNWPTIFRLFLSFFISRSVLASCFTFCHSFVQFWYSIFHSGEIYKFVFWRCPFQNQIRSLLILTEVCREFWVTPAKWGHDGLFPDALQFIVTRQPPNMFLSYLHLFIPAQCRCRGLLLHLITLSDTHKYTQKAGLLWMRDRFVSENTTWQCKRVMPPAGCETSIPAVERPQTHALDRPATRINQSEPLPPKKTILI